MCRLRERGTWWVGVGHTWRGVYDREPTPAFPFGGHIEPGNVTTFNVSAGWKGGPLSLQLSGSYSHEGISEFNGIPGFRTRRPLYGIGLGKLCLDQCLGFDLVASWTHALKNTVINPPIFLTPFVEAFNSNSNVYRLRFEHAFTTGDWSYGPIVSYLFRDTNAWAPTAFQFIPAKTRWSAGGNLRYFIGTQTVLYASLEHVWVNEGGRPVAIPGVSIPDLSFTGWAVTTGGTFQF